MVDISNDNVQLLAGRTAISSVRFHISSATSGAAFDATTGWIDLGAIDPASPSFEFNKTLVDAKTGSPAVTKQRHISDYEGTMSADIIDYNDIAMNAAIGTTIDPVYNQPAIPVTTAVAAGASTRSLIFVTTGDATNYAVGDWISVDLGDTAFSWKEVKKVIAVDTVADTLTVQGTLSQVPAVAAAVAKIESVENVIGGNSLRDYQMRVVASFNDQSTMVLHAPKGNFTAPVSPTLGDNGSLAKIPLQFQILGTFFTNGSCQEVKLASHYAFYNEVC